jgi:hypothetical protein
VRDVSTTRRRRRSMHRTEEEMVDNQKVERETERERRWEGVHSCE